MLRKNKIEIEVLRLNTKVIRVVGYEIKNDDIDSSFIGIDDDGYLKILNDNCLPSSVFDIIPSCLLDTLLRVSKKDNTIMVLGNTKINEILSCNGFDYVLNLFQNLCNFINELEYSCNISSYDVE